MKMRNTK